MLVRSVLTQTERVEKVLAAANAVLTQAEDLIGSKRQHQNGLKLLGVVESSLRKLIGKPERRSFWGARTMGGPPRLRG